MVVLAPMALMVMTLGAGSALAAGRGAAETCVTAGYRAGSAAFDMCVARISGDDPLAALEGGDTAAHGNGKQARPAETPDPLAVMAPAKPPAAGVLPVIAPPRETLPSSFSAPPVMAPPPATGAGGPPPAPAGGTGWWPAAPTPPTLPAIVSPTPPSWNFGTQ
jgi:hypothetical protein